MFVGICLQIKCNSIHRVAFLCEVLRRNVAHHRLAIDSKLLPSANPFGIQWPRLLACGLHAPSGRTILGLESCALFALFSLHRLRLTSPLLSGFALLYSHESPWAIVASLHSLGCIHRSLHYAVPASLHSRWLQPAPMERSDYGGKQACAHSSRLRRIVSSHRASPLRRKSPPVLDLRYFV